MQIQHIYGHRPLPCWLVECRYPHEECASQLFVHVRPIATPTLTERIVAMHYLGKVAAQSHSTLRKYMISIPQFHRPHQSTCFNRGPHNVLVTGSATESIRCYLALNDITDHGVCQCPCLDVSPQGYDAKSRRDSQRSQDHPLLWVDYAHMPS